jgi:hypothetical protein
MKNNMLKFFERDVDITYKNCTLHWTLKETINILGSHITNAALSKFKRFTL